MSNPKIWQPPGAPKPDYEGDPGARTRRPAGKGRPIVFPRKGKRNRFQRFLWELVNQFHRINLALAYFKSSVVAGAPEAEAQAPYLAAIKFYKEGPFFTRWKPELDNPSTHIDPVISAEGYILDVRVISKAFSDKKPGQSSSDTVVYPYPSSSSQAPEP